ncbi:MAG TPA: hypothetical protein VJY35_15095, partial [Candidatus Eisenbacteria bacterium]|nr:hypothetical protein [Candidatus Eisenbacteria bacterium]
MDARREEHATSRDSRAPWALALLVVAGLAWFRIFSTWFAQDDFRWLLRAASGPAPAFTTPRVLSMSLYFRAVHALAGTDPVVFHAIQLGLHLLTGLLLYLVVARRARPGPAAATAALYLTSPALFDALHWISAIADLMCGAFLALAVWLVLGARGAGRAWLAVMAYALALASKEIAVGAAPVLAVLH